MPRNRKAERAAEKKQEELDRKREAEKERAREEESRQASQDLQAELERDEQRRQDLAEQARQRSRERHKQERHLEAKKQEHEQLRHTERRSDRLHESRVAEATAGRQGDAREAQIGAGRQEAANEEKSRAQQQDRRQSTVEVQRHADAEDARANQRANERQQTRREEEGTANRQAQAKEANTQQRQAEDRSRQQQEDRQSAAADSRRADAAQAAAADQRRQEAARGRQTDRQDADRAGARDDARAEAQRAQRLEQAKDAGARDRQAQSRAEREQPSVKALSARLPSGDLSNGLPWLITSGNRIVSAEAGSPVILRGVNRSGLEYSSSDAVDFLSAAGITEADVGEMTGDWGANVIRIPFNQDWALSGRGARSNVEYLDNLDQLIYWASSHGAYSILDLQWLDADTPFGTFTDPKTGIVSVNHVAPLPNLDSIAVWTMLATRYQHEPAVLFDIFNEPHNPLADDTMPLQTIREDGTLVSATAVGFKEWLPWARQLVAAIRRPHPNSLILVPGINWAYDLSKMPLTILPGGPETFANIVYSTHVYTTKGPAFTAGTSPEAIPTLPAVAASDNPNWQTAFADLARKLPVFVGEWGGSDDEATPWGEELALYMSSLGLSWTAWSWVDYPPLRKRSPRTGRYEATRFGHLVRYYLKQP